MPATRSKIVVQQGSYEPEYWLFRNKDTGVPLDLTQPGYTVTGAVNSRLNGTGDTLATLSDGAAFQRTADGRVYFQPPVALQRTWDFRWGYYQFEISHPTGQSVWFATGPFVVQPEFVH